MIFRTRATTSCDVMPAGLSMIKAPSTGNILDCELPIGDFLCAAHNASVVKSLPMRSSRRRAVKVEQPDLEQSQDQAKARERLFQRAAKLLAARQRSVEELRQRLLAGRGSTP